MLSTPGLLMLRRSSCCMDFLSSHPTFDAVAAQLNAEGLRTLTPTQRGYTATARPTRRRDYRTAATADDVIALLDTAGLAQAHIVGHDWGGNQAWGAAGWHPDRIASLTALSIPHPAAFLKALRTSKQGLLSWYMALFQLPALPEASSARTLAKSLRDSGLPAEFADQLRRRDERTRRADRRTELVSRDALLHDDHRLAGSPCRPPTSGAAMILPWLGLLPS